MSTPRYEIVVSRRNLPDGTPEWAEYAEWRLTYFPCVTTRFPSAR